MISPQHVKKQDVKTKCGVCFVCSVMSFIFTFALYIDLYKIYTRYTGITHIPIYLDIAGAFNNKVCAG